MVIPQIKEDSNELQSKTYGCIIIVLIKIHVKVIPHLKQLPLFTQKEKRKKEEEETAAPLCCIIISSIHVKEIITQPEMDVVAIMSNALESHPNYKLQNKSGICQLNHILIYLVEIIYLSCKENQARLAISVKVAF